MTQSFALALQPSAEELAHHAYGGEIWADAIALCREAGRRAAARYSNLEAEQHFEHAANALAREDLAGQRLEEAIALRLELHDRRAEPARCEK